MVCDKYPMSLLPQVDIRVQDNLEEELDLEECEREDQTSQSVDHLYLIIPILYKPE